MRVYHSSKLLFTELSEEAYLPCCEANFLFQYWTLARQELSPREHYHQPFIAAVLQEVARAQLNQSLKFLSSEW